MCSKWKILELAIGLANIIIAADCFSLFPQSPCSGPAKGKTIIITASGVLLFGALLAQKQHRANILLFWLMALLIFIGTIIHEILICYFIPTFLCAYVFLLVVMGLLIYRAYIEEVYASTLHKPEGDADKSNKIQSPAPEDAKPPLYKAISLTAEIA
ncbi:uncharacterized protein LOC108111920 [Drosophila eugracilis]|uniref:uncharacterized protein LOC108111920 n=1 Tax=Drosophila eugracilis TaxID=29029 RepID=UPI0007E5DC36|nr:uncharacterized protein LOC108111920 [Drosophila eugracilis]